ncbi:hypothetical protein EBZ39_08005 [bacterium]|nr:hypothetical protein [bacterium]
MNITFSNLDVFSKAVEERIQKIPPVLKDALIVERGRMIERTKGGKDVGGNRFVAYSRKNPGRDWRDVRIANDKQVAIVDLTFDGDMLNPNGMSIEITRDGSKFLATISFVDAKQARKATGHQTGQLGLIKFRPREFFGFSQPQRRTIASKIRDAK